MNNFRYLIVFLSILFLATSCGEEKLNDTKKIETALLLSGDNRQELEKVLNHYSVDKKDTLKLKAAEFLIRNMIHHRSMSGECIKNYIKTIDSSYQQIVLPARSVYYMIPARLDSLKSYVKTEADIEKITADFLIKNIEYSFKVWENSTYEPRIPFEDFCEYILPYKHSEEPLILWKDSLDSQENNSRDFNTYELNMNMVNMYHTYMNTSQYYVTYMRLFTNKNIHTGSDNLKYRAFMDLAFMRSKGIPTAIDFIPFVDISKNSYWTTTINRKHLGNNHTFLNKDFSSKVFRKTYSLNPIPDDKTNFIPDFIRDPYNKDVTAIYQNVTTVEYDFEDVPPNVKNAYLGVFYNGEWCEVAWSELTNGKTSFKDMGRDVVYMPIYYNGKDKIYAKNAILLDRNGNISEIGIPNHKRQSITLKRISAYNVSGEDRAKSIIEAKIAACNIIENVKLDTLATFTHSKYNDFDTLNVNSDKKYKCWVFFSKEYSYLSEVQFFDKNGVQVQGRTIWFDRDNKTSFKSSSKQSKLFDNDILTSSAANGAIGILLDKPTAISYVKYMPENDRCGIMPGNEYELFYLNNGEWVSLTKKIATDYEIDFKDVPVNALLWVHDYGKECDERPFTISNEKLKFW